MTTEQDRAKLLPCPFCGAEPHISRMRDESLWSHDEVEKTRVYCGGCYIATDYTEEGQDPEAIEKWNTRVGLAAQQAPAAAKSEPVAHAAARVVDAWAKFGATREFMDEMDRLSQALAAPPSAQQEKGEPVALLHHDGEVADMATNEAQHAYLLSLPSGTPLYTAPQTIFAQRLTDEEVGDLWRKWHDLDDASYADLIEAAVEALVKKNGLTLKDTTK
jgi:Lar family restriction alleviation protein